MRITRDLEVTPGEDGRLKLRKRVLSAVVVFITVALLVFWTQFVIGLREFSTDMGAWSDGASIRKASPWTPHIALWLAPVLIIAMAVLFLRAFSKKKEPNQQPRQQRP